MLWVYSQGPKPIAGHNTEEGDALERELKRLLKK